MLLECTTVFLGVVIFTCNGDGTIETTEVDIGTNISLPCNFVYHNLSYPGAAWPFKRYWVLPNTTVVDDSFDTDGKFTVIETNVYTFNLFINGIEAQELGTYECVMIWTQTDYKSNVIRINLIEYKSDDDEYSPESSKMNTLYGFIVGVVTVLIIIVMCLLLKEFCYKKPHANQLQRNGSAHLTSHERVTHHF